jgi:membrane-bound inhibitor of C-type lysozyme
MTKNVLTIVMLTALFVTSCKETPKQENKETISKEIVQKTADEIIIGKETDKAGNVLEYLFNNTKNTATLKLKGETIELVADSTMASGANYKNDHYYFTSWHGTTTIKKDGKIIFEAGEETMPK